MAGNTKSMGVAYRDQLVQGSSTNDNAITGDIGELVSSTIPVASTVSLTSTTAANITSIVLTPGDWDIDALIDFAPAASTSVTQLNVSISLTSATLSSQPGGSGLDPDATTTINSAAYVPAALMAYSAGTVRLLIAATTTVYLVAKATFSVSTMTAYGTIRARRCR